MRYLNKVNEQSLIYIAELIKSNISSKDFIKSTRVFLCGGSIMNEHSVRFKLQNLFNIRNANQFNSNFDISYPEDVFDEILASGKHDLLSLESLLAESVDVIVIVIESQGSIAELGAFVNDSNLIEKTIAVNDIKYKNSKSFINQGPLKLLRKSNTKSALYVDFNNVEECFEELIKNIGSIAKKNKNKQELTLLNLDSFILPLLYITNDLHRDILHKMVSSVIKNKKYSEEIISSALFSMVKKRLIEKNNDHYKLSTTGIKYFKEKLFSFQSPIVDKIRIDFLNLAYRGRGYSQKSFRQTTLDASDSKNSLFD